ncbi:MAG: 3-oxoacyl-ACP reductase FabG [Lentisphaeria bacterium]|nr:3-oxoacyl-ACP reductase FabG [Lentisphaeria bacterium]
MPSDSSFARQVVVVTGGTRGIGAAISSAFLAEGARVYATYSGNDAAAETFARSQADLPGALTLHKFDVGDYAAGEAFFASLDETAGRIDVLVNNAGIRKDAVVGMMPADDWAAVIRVNLTGTYIMSKLAVMRMSRQRHGRVISITSPSGEMGFEGQANYAASKAGQVAFSRSLSKEVAKRNITVNCVSPGFIDTELIADLTPERLAAYKKSVPMRRFGTPADVADAVLFLASEKAAYITGETLHVTGGL